MSAVAIAELPVVLAQALALALVPHREQQAVVAVHWPAAAVGPAQVPKSVLKPEEQVDYTAALPAAAAAAWAAHSVRNAGTAAPSTAAHLHTAGVLALAYLRAEAAR